MLARRLDGRCSARSQLAMVLESTPSRLASSFCVRPQAHGPKAHDGSILTDRPSRRSALDCRLAAAGLSSDGLCAWQGSIGPSTLVRTRPGSLLACSGVVPRTRDSSGDSGLRFETYSFLARVLLLWIIVPFLGVVVIVGTAVGLVAWVLLPLAVMADLLHVLVDLARGDKEGVRDALSFEMTKPFTIGPLIGVFGAWFIAKAVLGLHRRDS